MTVPADRQDAALFVPDGDLLVSRAGVAHRADEYEEATLDVLLEMQTRHFWYRGRHRFLLAAVRQALAARSLEAGALGAIDVGGGCGGWIEYLLRQRSVRFGELALADSSLRALRHAGAVLHAPIPRYRVDLHDLGWDARWDVVFLLDVLEHINDDTAVVEQIRRALKPNGLLFVTAPALRAFWSYNDELAGHQRRYSARDLAALGDRCGLALIRARYFMFFLSPLVLLRRLRNARVRASSPEQKREILARTHQVPARPLNWLLTLVSALETPAGLSLPFPWGASVLGVFRKLG